MNKQNRLYWLLFPKNSVVITSFFFNNSMYNSNDPGLNFRGRLSTVFPQNYEFSKI